LNKWGFLYVQFRGNAYYYIIPTLVYILVKTCGVYTSVHTIAFTRTMARDDMAWLGVGDSTEKVQE
jgi:hypothetical protein